MQVITESFMLVGTAVPSDEKMLNKQTDGWINRQTDKQKWIFLHKYQAK